MNVGCPTCGAPVEFRYDDSFVRVCDSCHAAVVRGDRGVETLGQIADITPTASPLKLFADGRYRGEGFLLVGRAQYKHPAGGIWDEWYAKMDDGRWGWLAEAQGRFYLTFQQQLPDQALIPPLQFLELGQPVAAIRSSIPFVVAEKGVARMLGARGEIPYRLVPGETYEYADLSGPSAAVVVASAGRPTAILTRSDLLEFLAHQRSQVNGS